MCFIDKNVKFCYDDLMSLIAGYARQSKKRPRYGVYLLLICFVVVIIFVVINKIPVKTAIVKPEITTTTNDTIPNEYYLKDVNHKVAKMTFTNQVDAKNQPTDNFSEISTSTINRVYCYTKLESSNVPNVVRHVWLAPSGVEVADIKLTITKKTAHTWSYVNLHGAKTGNWTVEVRQPQGQILAKKTFLLYH